jgi:hypothetical protein
VLARPPRLKNEGATMTGTTSPTRTATAVGRYVTFWNTQGEEQRALAKSVFSVDVTYHAPVGVQVGADQLIALSDQFAKHLGQLTFRPTTEPEVMRDRARLRWEILREGESFATGTDVIVVDEQGRVASVTAFLDHAPEGFDPHLHT